MPWNATKTVSTATRLFIPSFLAMLLTISTRYSSAQAAAAPVLKQPTLLPEGYREWRLISVAHEEGDLHDLRAILANDAAAKAFRSNAASFPEGSMIVRLAWKHSASAENNRAFGRDQSFVAGTPTNIQLMVRDTKTYAATNGWGYAQFPEPGASNEAAHPDACAGCHLAAKDRAYVFTHYSR